MRAIHASLLSLPLLVVITGCDERKVGRADGGGDARSIDARPGTPDARQDFSSGDARSDTGGLHDTFLADTAPSRDVGSKSDAPLGGCRTVGTPATGTTGSKGKADILFIIDNSATMVQEQGGLLNAMSTLEASLGSTASYRVGVVTTDLGVPYSVPTCIGCGDDGKLQSQPSLSSCQAPASKYLQNDRGSKSYSGSLAGAFRCLASVGTNGCGFEQPLQSAAVFLSNPNSFVRKDASLVLVIVSDEDDCSAKNPTLYDPSNTSLGALTSFRCFSQGITCDQSNPAQLGTHTNCKPAVGGLLQDVSWYVKLVKGLKPAGRVGVVAIVGPPSPVNVGSSTGGQPVLKPSCQTTNGLAVPAIRTKAFADAFAPHAKLHSICSSSYAPAMKDVATLVQSL